MNKHTPGPLTVRPTVRQIEIVDKDGEIVFTRSWPSHSSSDKTIDDVLECRNFTGKFLADYSKWRKSEPMTVSSGFGSVRLANRAEILAAKKAS